MRALKGTEVASPSWHRSSLAADKFWRRFGNTHYLHIFQYFLALPGTCDEFSFNSLHAHLAEKCEKALRFKIFRETKGGDSEAPGWGAKKVTTQSGHSRAPKAFAKNSYFPDRFCIVCSSGFIWLPVPAHPSCSKWIKSITFQDISRIQGGPSWSPRMGTQKSDHPKWTPRSPQGICEKQTFSW